MKHPFNKSEIITIFELSLLALSDADFFDQLVDETDICDHAMLDLREKLQKFMNKEVKQ